MPSIKAVDQIWVPAHTLMGDVAKDPYRKTSGETEKYTSLEDMIAALEKVDKDISRLMYYSQTELELIGAMAQMLRKQEKYEKGILLIETVIKQMKNSKIDLEWQWNGVSFLLRILSGLYFCIQNYEKSLQGATYVKKVMLKRRSASNLSEILDAKPFLIKTLINALLGFLMTILVLIVIIKSNNFFDSDVSF